jgi:prevent-host-death family protein
MAKGPGMPEGTVTGEHFVERLLDAVQEVTGPAATSGQGRRAREATASMTSVGIRELAASVSAVVADVANSGRPAVVTKHGQPIAAVVAIADLEDLLAIRVPRDAAATPTGNGHEHGDDPTR